MLYAVEFVLKECIEDAEKYDSAFREKIKKINRDIIAYDFKSNNNESILFIIIRESTNTFSELLKLFLLDSIGIRKRVYL